MANKAWGNGPPKWSRGGGRVYSHNGRKDIDPDPVRREAGDEPFPLGEGRVPPVADGKGRVRVMQVGAVPAGEEG